MAQMAWHLGMIYGSYTPPPSTPANSAYAPISNPSAVPMSVQVKNGCSYTVTQSWNACVLQLYIKFRCCFTHVFSENGAFGWFGLLWAVHTRRRSSSHTLVMLAEQWDLPRLEIAGLLPEQQWLRWHWFSIVQLSQILFSHWQVV